MSFRGIKLVNFRSYTEQSFTFEPSVNIIVGPNGSGKTNLLESLYAISTSKSFRVSDDELVQSDAPWYRIKADTSQGDVFISYDPSKSSNARKTIKIDNKNLKVTELIGYNPTTLFEPSHLQLVSGAPELRRRFLDGILSQLQSNYLDSLLRYRKTLKHRNALLKRSNPKEDELFVWDVKLAQYGDIINQARTSLIDQFNTHITELYREFSADDAVVSLRYKSSISGDDYASTMMAELKNRLKRDKIYGATSVGPHREDLEILYKDNSLQTHGSRGEVRTLMLVLKMLELKTLEENSKFKPVLLLDDVFSELDSSRRQAVVSHLKDYQVFITTTDADAVLEYFPEHVNTIELNQ